MDADKFLTKFFTERQPILLMDQQCGEFGFCGCNGSIHGPRISPLLPQAERIEAVKAFVAKSSIDDLIGELIRQMEIVLAGLEDAEAEIECADIAAAIRRGA